MAAKKVRSRVATARAKAAKKVIKKRTTGGKRPARRSSTAKRRPARPSARKKATARPATRRKRPVKAQPRRAAARKAAKKAPAKRAPKRAPMKKASATRSPKRAPQPAQKPIRKAAGTTKPAKAEAKTPAKRPVVPAVPPAVKASTPTPKRRPRHAPPPALHRERRRLADLGDDVDERVPAEGPDDTERLISAAHSGADELRHMLAEHTESSPALAGGDIDARWTDAYAVGDEAPGGDNPTPGQDRVEDIGRALGINYEDREELRGSDKVAERDKHRWELDPASSEDWPHNTD